MSNLPQAVPLNSFIKVSNSKVCFHKLLVSHNALFNVFIFEGSYW